MAEFDQQPEKKSAKNINLCMSHELEALDRENSLGFVKTKSDASLLVRHGAGDTLFVLVYVDDIIITGSNTLSVNQVITSLASKFSIKDLGNLHYFLGVEVIRSSNSLILTQTNYVNEILNDELMTDCKSVNTPMSASELLTLSDGIHLTDATRYCRVLGRLQNLSFTRPDIAYAVNKLSQFMQALSDLHWKAVKRVLRYLRDWSRDIVDRVSTSGCILFLGHNPISWSSKKQNTVSRSSTESEYRAVANALSETLWVTNLLMSYAFQYISYPKFIVTILEPHS
uniref:Reverse transcriptase Ty1/copia-type domain-containing protein n=1 Tax=Solanum lycopersicum TaxID=4081 RepID=A0A3Q7H8A5_SOLLC